MSAELLTFGPDVGAGARAGSHIAEFRAVLASSRSRWRKGERKSKVARDKFRQRERERERTCESSLRGTTSRGWDMVVEIFVGFRCDIR